MVGTIEENVFDPLGRRNVTIVSDQHIRTSVWIYFSKSRKTKQIINGDLSDCGLAEWINIYDSCLVDPQGPLIVTACRYRTLWSLSSHILFVRPHFANSSENQSLCPGRVDHWRLLTCSFFCLLQKICGLVRRQAATTAGNSNEPSIPQLS